MARKNFNAGTLTAPLPAVMVSVGDMEQSNILTIAWTGILSSTPPRTYISVRKERHSYEIIKRTGEFVINLTTERLCRITDYVGVYTGAKVDKFKVTGLTKEKSLAVSAPTIKEAPVSLECRVFDIIESGTHDIFMADIVNVSCDEELLDEKGRICFERAGLIAYSHGEYYALGKKLGKFGFGTDSTLGDIALTEEERRKGFIPCPDEKKKPRKEAKRPEGWAKPKSRKKGIKKGGKAKKRMLSRKKK
jgi:flavin reductase (DIM6/NTAB) family NADH-FMN oxidoreductase RutF